MAGIWPNGIICEAGAAQLADITDGDAATVTVVVDEQYRIFAPIIGIIVIGQGSTPKTASNITGIIPPGGFLDIKATSTSLYLYCPDSEDDYGTDMDGSAYVVKLSNNA